MSLQEARFERAANDDPSSYTRAGGPVASIRGDAVPAVLIPETAQAQQQKSDPLDQAEIPVGSAGEVAVNLFR